MKRIVRARDETIVERLRGYSGMPKVFYTHLRQNKNIKSPHIQNMDFTWPFCCSETIILSHWMHRHKRGDYFPKLKNYPINTFILISTNPPTHPPILDSMRLSKLIILEHIPSGVGRGRYDSPSLINNKSVFHEKKNIYIIYLSFRFKFQLAIKKKKIILPLNFT